jgi:polyisoprenoid-binding protein YceI
MHSSINFSVRHLGINDVRGHFDEFAGSIMLDNAAIKEATGTIQVKSINTGVQMRDNHLRTAAFFDATNYPVITFKTKSVEPNGAETVLIADFTMRGVTKELRLPVKLSGPVKDPQGKFRIGLEAKANLNRKDYGINYNAVLESGVAAVGEEVTLEINAEGIKEQAKK